MPIDLAIIQSLYAAIDERSQVLGTSRPFWLKAAPSAGDPMLADDLAQIQRWIEESTANFYDSTVAVPASTSVPFRRFRWGTPGVNETDIREVLGLPVYGGTRNWTRQYPARVNFTPSPSRPAGSPIITDADLGIVGPPVYADTTPVAGGDVALMGRTGYHYQRSGTQWLRCLLQRGTGVRVIEAGGRVAPGDYINDTTVSQITAAMTLLRRTRQGSARWHGTRRYVPFSAYQQAATWAAAKGEAEAALVDGVISNASMASGRTRGTITPVGVEPYGAEGFNYLVHPEVTGMPSIARDRTVRVYAVSGYNPPYGWDGGDNVSEWDDTAGVPAVEGYFSVGSGAASGATAVLAATLGSSALVWCSEPTLNPNTGGPRTFSRQWSADSLGVMVDWHFDNFG